MNLDLFTVVAQVVNFLFLTALLRRFLYRPIVRVMEERERWIRESLAQARQEQGEAQALEEKCQTRLRELDELRLQRLTEVEQEVTRSRAELLSQARREVDALEAQWRETQRREFQGLEAQGARQAALVVLEVARQALRELASADLDHQMIDVFLSRVTEVPAGTPVISTAWPLGETEQARLRERFPGARFEVEPALIAGVEVRAGDYKVGWSLQSYLHGLAESLKQC